MNRKNNSLHNDTEARIREALFTFIDQGQTPTVSGICENAGISRATFYRHYQDVPDLMEKTQRTIFIELMESFSSLDVLNGFVQRDALDILVQHIDRHRAFYRMLLDMPETAALGYDRVWEDFLLPLFQAHGVTKESHMKYYHCFYMAGFTAVLRRWLDCGDETAEEITDILWRYTDRMNRQDDSIQLVCN